MRVYQFRHARTEDGRNEAARMENCNYDFTDSPANHLPLSVFSAILARRLFAFITLYLL